MDWTRSPKPLGSELEKHRGMQIRAFLARLLIFCAALGAVPGAVHADVYRIIDRDDEALQARIDLIQQAQKEIIMVYYSFGKDATSFQILSLLKEAREKRGVKVYLLIDDYNNKIKKPTLGVLEKAGIEIAFYNRFDLQQVQLFSHRMHDKYIIVDYTKLLMGGRNLRDSYYGFGEKLFSDRDVYIEGPSTYVARQFFIERWNSNRVIAEPTSEKPWRVRRAEAALQAARELLKHHPFVKLNTGTQWGSVGTTSSQVNFIHDNVRGSSTPLADVTDTAETYIAEINAANTSIELESPYVVPTKKLWKALKEARKRNVKIRLLTNSAISGDTVLAQAAYQNSKKRLLEMGVELWEFEVKDVTLHSKSAVFDGKRSIIGSYNLDPRSQNINTETLAVVEDPAIAQELEASMQKKLAYARRIGPNGKPIGSKTKFPGLSFGQKVAFRFWQYTLAVLLRSQI